MTYSVTYTNSIGARRTMAFSHRDQAWSFVRRCDARGWSAGYPQATR